MTDDWWKDDPIVEGGANWWENDPIVSPPNGGAPELADTRVAGPSNAPGAALIRRPDEPTGSRRLPGDEATPAPLSPPPVARGPAAPETTAELLAQAEQMRLDALRNVGAWADPRETTTPASQQAAMEQIAAREGEAERSPFRDESLVDTAGRRLQGAAVGATGPIAAIPERVAISETEFQEAVRAQAPERVLEAIRSRTRLIGILEGGVSQESGEPLTAEERDSLEARIGDTETAIQSWRDLDASEAIPTRETSLYQTGDTIREAVTDVTGAPDPRDQSFWQNLAVGAGQLASQAVTAVATTKGLGAIGGLAAGAAQGAAQAGAGAYEEALAAGADEETARQAASWNSVIGTSEILPITRALRILPRSIRRRAAEAFSSRLGNVFASAGEEGAQEFASTVLSNLVAIGLYDPDRSWGEGGLEATAIGAILGGGMGALGGPARDVERPAPRGLGPLPTPAPPPEQFGPQPPMQLTPGQRVGGPGDPLRLRPDQRAPETLELTPEMQVFPTATPEDIASDLPTEEIVSGRQIIDDLLSGRGRSDRVVSPSQPIAPIADAAPRAPRGLGAGSVQQPPADQLEVPAAPEATPITPEAQTGIPSAPAAPPVDPTRARELGRTRPLARPDLPSAPEAATVQAPEAPAGATEAGAPPAQTVQPPATDGAPAAPAPTDAAAEPGWIEIPETVPNERGGDPVPTGNTVWFNPATGDVSADPPAAAAPAAAPQTPAPPAPVAPAPSARSAALAAPATVSGAAAPAPAPAAGRGAWLRVEAAAQSGDLTGLDETVGDHRIIGIGKSAVRVEGPRGTSWETKTNRADLTLSLLRSAVPAPAAQAGPSGRVVEDAEIVPEAPASQRQPAAAAAAPAADPAAVARREQAYQRIEAALPALRADLDQMGLSNVGLAMSRRLKSQGRFVSVGDDMGIIVGASLNPTNTVRHEAIHALREMGLFTDAEWRDLTRMAEKEWLAKHDIANRYAPRNAQERPLTREELIEEAIAEEFAAATTDGRVERRGLIGRAFGKIRAFLAAVNRWLGGAGVRRPEDIFADALEGTVGARPRQQQSGDPTLVPGMGVRAARGNRTAEQTATVRRGEETMEPFGLQPKPKRKPTTRDVAAALEGRQRALYGTIARGDYSTEASERIADWMIEEVMYEVEQAEANPSRSAVGWYSQKYQDALDLLGEAFPEFVDANSIADSALPGVQLLGTPEAARSFYTALMAITSDGAKVADNFRFAATAYEDFRQTGRVNTDVTFGGERNSSMRTNLRNIQKVLDEHGAGGMPSFLLRKDSITNLKKIAAAQGQSFSSDYKASTRLPYSAVVFGPKLGAFYANLMGDTGYLTMDRWWSRTFNRYRGTLLQQPTEQGLERVKELVTAEERLNAPASEMTDDEVLARIIPYVQSYKAKGFKNGTELEKAANTLYKAAFEGLEDQPFNASDRSFMIDTTVRAQNRLAERGVDLTVADIQAVLWYYEKRLYGELGARQTQDISYGDLARQVGARVLASRGDPAGRSADELAGEAGDADVSDGGTAGEASGAGLDRTGQDPVTGKRPRAKGRGPGRAAAVRDQRPLRGPQGAATPFVDLPGGVAQHAVAEDLQGLTSAEAVEAFLAKPGWAALTATRSDRNPAQNARSQAQLEQDLNGAGIAYIPVEGMYKGESDGTSFLVVADEKTAMTLGRRYGQESILTRDGLVYTAGRVLPNTPATGSTVVGPAAREQDFFSVLPSGEAFSMDLDFSQGPGVAVMPEGYGTNPALPQLPIRPDGMAELHHWSDRDLATVDPSFAGSGPLAGRERGWGVKMSFWGVNPRDGVRDPGTGYVKESGLGDRHHVALVPAESLYPYFEDPAGLRSEGMTDAQYHAAIRDAGYRGAYVTDDGSPRAPLGNVAVLFDPISVQPAARVVSKDQAAYHGTPHDFDAFSTDYMGSGEGAQVYGWGLYFASRREVAQHYRAVLSNPRGAYTFEVDGETTSAETDDALADALGLDAPQIRHPVTFAIGAMRRGSTLGQAVEKMRKAYPHFDGDNLDAAEEALYEARPEVVGKKGRLFTVDVPDNDELIAYDETVADQPPKVRAILEEIIADLGPRTNDTGRTLSDYYWLDDPLSMPADEFYSSIRLMFKDGALDADDLPGASPETLARLDQFGVNMDEFASRFLASRGIPGHRFLDGSSRRKGEGAYNYVIYDDKRVSVVSKEQRQRVTDNPAFREWFGDSKVVDKNGEPEVVYHGTRSDIRAFDSERARAEGGAFFFARDEMRRPASAANTYAGGPGGNVMPVYLRMENPLIAGFSQSLPDDATDAQIDLYQRRVDAFNARLDDPGAKEEYFRQQVERARAEGHDGVIIKNVRDDAVDMNGAVETNVYAVFEPSQIKSVFNRGTFERGNPRIREQRSPILSPKGHAAAAMGGALHIPSWDVWALLTEANKPLWTRAKGASRALVNQARWHLQDTMLPLVRAKTAIERFLGGPLPEEMDVVGAEITYSGKAGQHLRVIDFQYQMPVIDLIAQSERLDVKSVGRWLTARHAVERNRVIASRYKAGSNDVRASAGSGMSDEQARQILQDALRGPDARRLQEIGRLVDELRERSLALRVDAGLMSQAQADVWRRTFRHYVPLKGFEETDYADAQASLKQSRGFSTTGKESERMKGRASEAFNPLTAIFVQAQEVAIRAEKNRVGQAFLKLVETYPSEALWEMNKPKMTHSYNAATGLVEMRSSEAAGEGAMTVKRDGEEYKIVIHDERVARAMGTMGADQMNGVFQVLAPLSRFWSMTRTTLSPTFIPINATRDIIAAMINLQSVKDPVLRKALTKAIRRDWFKALRGAYRGADTRADTEWSQYFQEYQESGAAVSFFKLEDPKVAKEDLEWRVNLASGNALDKALRSSTSMRAVFSNRDNPFVSSVERINLAVDNAVRLAAFVEARKQGLTPQKAAILSKNLTVNFNKRGLQTPWINVLMPFFNASVQGGVVTLRALTSKRVIMAAAGMIGFGFLRDLANAFLSDEDETGTKYYDRIENSRLQRGAQFMLGRDSQTAFAFPMPYGYNVFDYAGVQLGKVVRGVKDPDEAFGDVVASVFGSFSPIQGEDFATTVMPFFVDPFWQMQGNQNSFGSPIYPTFWDETVPDAHQHFPSATQMSQNLTQGLNEAAGGDTRRSGAWASVTDFSPETIDYLSAYVGGALGSFTGRMNDLIVKAMDGTLEEADVRRAPYASQLVSSPSPWYDADRFYRFRAEVEDAVADMKAYEEGAEGRADDDQRRLARLGDELKEAMQEINGTGPFNPNSDARDRRTPRDKERVYQDFIRDYLRVMGPQAE